ncbi:hypothetical protein KW785_02820 [Candidatus Parcubacteria bacterium]|nr:hypothetical protein [Candidatus Parcubacteria bacterium]
MAGSKNSTQEFVPIKEVRDGILLEKSGGMRAILLCSSLNFSLKSDDERAAIILQFQDFLNSLDFSVEILVQSRRLDIRPYLALLEEQEKKQLNNLMKIQTREYIEFVRNFAESTNIMTKNFFVIVPYDPAIVSTGKANALTNLLQRKPETTSSSFSLPPASAWPAWARKKSSNSSTRPLTPARRRSLSRLPSSLMYNGQLIMYK